MRKLFSLAVLAVVGAASTALADGGKFTAGGISNEFGAVNDVKDGMLIVTSSTGRDQQVKLAEITAMSFTDVKDFNDAEKLRTTKPADAARLYGNAIRATSKAQRKLIQYRAVPVMDDAGLYGDAMVNFMDLYAANPTEATWELHPKKLPDGKSQYLQTAATVINSKIGTATFKNDAVAVKNLNGILLEIYNAQGNAVEAAKIAKALGVEVAVADPKVAAVNPGNPTPAVNAPATPVVDTVVVSRDEAIAVKAYRDQAEAYKKANQLEEAAAAYLRIAAFFPTRKPDASEALFAALEIQKQLKHDAEAKRLGEEIQRNYPDTAASLKAEKAGYPAIKKTP